MNDSLWQTTTSLQVIQTRAKLTAIIHQFFNGKGVLPVNTPALSQFANTDPNIESFIVQESDNKSSKHYFLQSSPEFPMKRLLAGGIGSIYQLCNVFRASEQGRYHNPEFTLLEWYRIDMDHFDLMSEMEELFNLINTQFPFYKISEKISYQDIFLKYTQLDPLATNADELCKYIEINLDSALYNPSSLTFDELLDYFMSHVIQDKMPDDSLIYVYDYPASQASLAQLNDDKKTARRFEVFVSGIELANGFHELRDADEQRIRFEAQQINRTDAGQNNWPMDEYLLDALQSGLPNCAGVAVGIERLLMLLVNAEHINEVLTFPFERA